MSACVMMSGFVVGGGFEIVASGNVIVCDCSRLVHRGWRSDCCRYWKLRRYGHGLGI
jgi:hypothetical protein